MFATQISHHGDRALASTQGNNSRNMLPALLRALPLAALAVLCVVFCSAAEAQTAHFSWSQATVVHGLGAPYGVAVDSSGNVYVAEVSLSQVQEIVAVNGSIPASPTINTLGSGFNSPEGIAVDASGNVFVSDYGHNAVKEIVAVNGSIPATPTIRTWTGFDGPRGLAVDSHGNIFVAASGAGLVQEMLAVGGSIPASPTVKTVESFSYPCGVAVDGSGNVYVSDTTSHWVYELYAVNGSIPLSPAVSYLSNFFDPEGIAVDGGGNVYVVDAIENALYEIGAGGGSLVQLGSVFNGPEGVTVDSTGRVFVADSYSGRVAQVTQTAGNFGAVDVNSASGETITLGFTFDTGGQMLPADVLAEGVSESDFADAGTGSCTTNGLSHTYVANEVCTMDVTFTPSTWGPRYGAVELRDDGGEVMSIGYVYGVGIAPLATFATAATSLIGTNFGDITGLTVDGFGDLFIADNNKSATQEIERSGTIDTVTTKAGPYAVAMDGGGNLFVAVDQGTTAIFEYYAVGDYTSFRQIASNFTFNYITGLAVDANGNVFAADYVGGAVYEVTAASGYTTVSTLPTGTVTPYGIAVDVNGNVFYSDDHNSSVSEIPAPGYSSVKVLNSTLGTPWGIALGGNGNIFVADYGNNALEEIMASGGYATVHTLVSGVTEIQAVALDPSGIVYYSIAGGASVTMLDYTAWPSLTFPATALGSTSNTQTVTLNNTGNQWLNFLAVGYPADFPENLADLNDCYTGGNVSAGNSCTVTVEFAPMWLGYLGAAVVLVDDSLYPPWEAVQEIDVDGKSLSTQKITFTDSLPASANYSTGLSYTLSAGGGASGNPVVFSVLSGPATVNGTTLNITGGGVVVVAADQAGNASYAPAPEVTQSIVIIQPAVLTSPTPGSTLTDSSTTFTWSPGGGITQYEIRIGTSGAGSSNVFSLTTTALTTGSVPVPPYGQKLYIRLFSLIGGKWQYTDYTCTESGAPVLAALSTPTPGSTLTGSSATFTWTAGGAVTEYEIRVGTTGAGSQNLYSLTTTALTSGLVSNIPTFGVPINVRLYSLINKAWQYQDYTVTESGSPVLATLSTPTPGSILTGSSATFTWTAGGGVSHYEIRVGTTGKGSKDLFVLFTNALSSGLVSNIPTTGGTLYVRLYSEINGVWQYKDYTYTEQ